MNRGKSKDKLKSFFKRCGQDTPPFFKKLRTVGLVVAAAGTAILASPIALPAAVTAIGGYLIVGGSVATAMSQAAVTEDSDCE
ncbi:hypothetical protein [Parvicella tangerina]|uniref:Uncharacterized protein n=1 Tax=Parvicella tangerina TaxID=2829795 RepID=A0A916JN10_9FLAO|nr:hypothetical protein [Parvicella tangerina]CAG5083117.1 hypothetical protein CRYO30217_02092 [Parvicella tangerina]